MKTIIAFLIVVLIFLLVAASITLSYGQDLVTSLQVESTVAGFQAGGTVQYETKKLWAFGGFYQRSTARSAEHREVNTFFGARLQVPLVNCERMALFGIMRTGFANEKFFVVVPGLETRINFGKRCGVGLGIGMRMNYPSISSRFIVKLF